MFDVSVACAIVAAVLMLLNRSCREELDDDFDG